VQLSRTGLLLILERAATDSSDPVNEYRSREAIAGFVFIGVVRDTCEKWSQEIRGQKSIDSHLLARAAVSSSRQAKLQFSTVPQALREWLCRFLPETAVF
jgi:uncharacterized NAD(P)/FAD-binding protein YdhS